ncbi:MAG: hypothetical protein J6R25_04060 [Bacteroidales bacterium]|nr:hypothetical protein [Bacteroidales bacterium]
MNKPYFETPKQVMFHDIDDPHSWLPGIAYKDEIICACCGGVYEIAEVCELSEGYVDQAIYPYEDWINLADEIYGGELPEGLTINEEDRIVEESAVDAEEYEQYAFHLEEEEEAQAVFANTWVDGIAMPEF